MWFEGDICEECNSETEFTIRKLYQEIQDELDVWYGSLSFENLAKVHEIDANTMYKETNEETQEMLDELAEEWVEWSTDTKVMWYNDLMGY
jgi:ubiquinone biosynthesis protein UbiJ